MILRRSEKSKRRVRISNSRKDVRRARRPETGPYNRKLLLGLALFCLAGLGSGALWLWWPTMAAGVEGWLKHQDDFLVKEIVVQGHCRTAREEIIKALAFAPRQLIFSFSLKEAQARVNALPFVRESRIRRSWPDRLEIEIEERQPVALLYLEGLYLVDAEGVVIAPPSENEKLDFPLISGVTLAQWRAEPQVWGKLLKKALDLLHVWENQGRQWPEKVAQIGLDEVCGVTVFTTGKVWELQLGTDGYEERLQRWRQVLEVLGGRAVAVNYFDCAGTGSVVVGLKPARAGGSVKAERNGQK
ncbi:MAG: FtsQ-type POTRA domain-containing protein [Deltaproteobacteria bacterium]|nr:FtsQ-type POTRA domain-containing protein [Deltaproteobacteria bacterium]